MRRLIITAAVGIVVLALSGTSNAQQISGDYIETRSADVYTGFCFANSEVGLVGDQAILGWRIAKGEWNGVRLDGLSVVGVVKAKATLGNPFDNPYPARSVVIVDRNATAEQQRALISFAQAMAGELLNNVVSVEASPISFEVSHAGGHYGKAALNAGIASISTRAIGENDHACGNEEIYYQPLAQTSHAMPAVAETDRFSGQGLGVVWNVHGKRSAFVGSFSRATSIE
jgi:hypothetical protein